MTWTRVFVNTSPQGSTIYDASSAGGLGRAITTRYWSNASGAAMVKRETWGLQVTMHLIQMGCGEPAQQFLRKTPWKISAIGQMLLVFDARSPEQRDVTDATFEKCSVTDATHPVDPTCYEHLVYLPPHSRPNMDTTLCPYGSNQLKASTATHQTSTWPSSAADEPQASLLPPAQTVDAQSFPPGPGTEDIYSWEASINNRSNSAPFFPLDPGFLSVDWSNPSLFTFPPTGDTPSLPAPSLPAPSLPAPSLPAPSLPAFTFPPTSDTPSFPAPSLPAFTFPPTSDTPSLPAFTFPPTSDTPSHPAHDSINPAWSDPSPFTFAPADGPPSLPAHDSAALPSDCDASHSQVTSSDDAQEGIQNMDLQLHKRGDDSTWAARNPGRPVIPTRLKGAPLTQAEKASRALKAAQCKKSEKALDDTISSFLDDQDKKMKDIGALHSVTEAHIKKLITYHTHYKKSRGPQLFNALVHAKNQEVNGARPVGSKLKIQEIHQMVTSDPSMQKENLTDGEIKEYIAQLQEHQLLKTGGLHSNNIAAARDLDGLRERCGTYATFFIAGGHVNDQTPATWYATDDAADFWEDVLDLMLNDVARKFEQWACSQGKNIVERDSLENMQKQVGRLILSGLRQMTGKDNIGMNYPNYIKSIVLSYSIVLDGWPATIPFTSPWNIHTVCEIRDLRDALKAGTCAWKRLTKTELEKYKEDLERRRAAGEMVGKPRKKRSDSGTSCKRKNTQRDEGERPAKKSRRSNKTGKVSRPEPKSREIIESSNEEASVNGEDLD
ncbi:hypothetical protein DEU56DRAFT_908942 [Suillus clintonianus]|uniref:uncharacterized protein n=1 Tax=Suillus clintonianus TaxID=1904413 RepID=UPI001B87096B|nr:uncharacterized protein DEU56DRAFT_908942 [Suillus clintonianus]KAG2149242.1 hypothetical protein DEU56DRAFT_908942 [Suillus clintonianus]